MRGHENCWGCGMGSLRARWLGTACPPHSPCARSPRLCSRSPQPLAHPRPAGTTQLVSPLAGPGMPKNGVTGVQSPGSGVVAGQDVLTARTGSLQPMRARREVEWATLAWRCKCAPSWRREEESGHIRDAPERARVATYGGPGSSRGGFPAISDPMQKVSADPYFNPTTFLPLFDSPHSAPRAVLSAREWFWATRKSRSG